LCFRFSRYLFSLLRVRLNDRLSDSFNDTLRRLIDWLIDCAMEIFYTVTVTVLFIFYGLLSQINLYDDDDGFIPRVGPNTSY